MDDTGGGGARDGYYAYDYEDEYERKRRMENPRRRDASTQTTGPSLLTSVLPSVLQTGDKRLGLMMLGSGAAVTMLGMSLFFNKTLMRIGNLLVIAGVPLTLGPSRVAGYFIQPQKARATACLALGIFLVFIGWPVFGIALEIFGLLNLFGNLFPVVLALAKQVPVVGTVLNAGGSNGRRSSSSGQNKRDRYYEEDEDYYYDGQQKDQERPRDDDRYY
jgi:Got1/Sft2-like family